MGICIPLEAKNTPELSTVPKKRGRPRRVNHDWPTIRVVSMDSRRYAQMTWRGGSRSLGPLDLTSPAPLLDRALDMALNGDKLDVDELRRLMQANKSARDATLTWADYARNHRPADPVAQYLKRRAVATVRRPKAPPVRNVPPQTPPTPVFMGLKAKASEIAFLRREATLKAESAAKRRQPVPSQIPPTAEKVTRSQYAAPAPRPKLKKRAYDKVLVLSVMLGRTKPDRLEDMQDPPPRDFLGRLLETIGLLSHDPTPAEAMAEGRRRYHEP